MPGPATVVLLGDVGMGKSTLVEKVTGFRGLSSDASQSFTRASRAFVTGCGRLMIIDTPGANSMSDKLQHNVWIAHALNYAPVSLIGIVVKAEMRIDNTVNSIRNYAERFQDLSDLLGVIVTHMDTVSWSKKELQNCMTEELGIDSVVLVGTGTPSTQLMTDILAECKTPQDLTINSANFLKYFKINNSNFKIMKTVNDEVGLFKTMLRDFEIAKASLSGQDAVDCVFEFQAYMLEQIYQAQRRVSEANGFTFDGDSTATANQAGHIANLTNQLRAVLFNVRTLALGYQSEAGISSLRKCPHCGLVWAKLEGCDGSTTCGNRMTKPDGRFGTLGTFTFTFDGKKLSFAKSGSRTLSRPPSATSARGAGCGQTISWSNMAPVPIPTEFTVNEGVKTDDVKSLPQKAMASFDLVYANLERSMSQSMQVTKA